MGSDTAQINAGKLDPAIKAEWLAALRSGEYGQCRNTMHRREDNGLRPAAHRRDSDSHRVPDSRRPMVVARPETPTSSVDSMSARDNSSEKNAEQIVSIAARMYGCRRTCKSFLGAKYDEVIGGYAKSIRHVATERKIGHLEAAHAMAKEMQALYADPIITICLMAAAVDIAEVAQ